MFAYKQMSPKVYIFISQSGSRKNVFSGKIDIILLKEVQAKSPHKADDQDQAWKNVLEALRKAFKQQKISFDPSL